MLRYQQYALGNATASIVDDDLDLAAEALTVDPNFLGFNGDASAIKRFLMDAAKWAPPIGGEHDAEARATLPSSQKQFALKLAELSTGLPFDGVTLFFNGYNGRIAQTYDTGGIYEEVGDRQVYMVFIPPGWNVALEACVDRLECPPRRWGTGYIKANKKPQWVMLYLPFQNQGLTPGLDKGSPIRYVAVNTLDERTQQQIDNQINAQNRIDSGTYKEIIKDTADNYKTVQNLTEIINHGVADQHQMQQLMEELRIKREAAAAGTRAIEEAKNAARVDAELAGLGGMNTTTIVAVGGAIALLGLIVYMRFG